MLRPYQVEAIERVRQAMWQGARAVCLQMSTGAGKTHTAAEVIRRGIAQHGRIVFAAHLDALIDDTSSRLEKAEIAHGIVQASRKRTPDAPVQVASLQTLAARQDAPPADFFILDECHRAMAASVRAVLERYPRALLLGLTATPQRGDGQSLGDVFQELVTGPSMKELVAQGHLVSAEVLSPPAPLDGSLARDPVQALQEFAPGRPSMIFCRDAAAAEKLAERIGSRAVVILGGTSRTARREARERLAAGEPLVLVGCGVFLEGWDSPAVDTVVLARQFSVCGSYLQAVGRALRPSPATGKTRATVIDLTGAAILHGLPDDDRVWSLDGPPRRAGDDLKVILMRCAHCFAVFHSGPTECPRCGESIRGGRVARRATRIERQELSRLDERPLEVRDAIAIRGIEKRLRATGRFSEQQIPRIAQSIFRKQRVRTPAAKEASA
jgi:superfamily II DNA or RNA helicase